MKAEEVKKGLQKYASTSDAEFLQRFFKTGEGQYGAGDIFIGVRVPATRKVCREFKDLPLNEVQKLLDSKVHEHRLAGLIILTYQYPKADEWQKHKIYDFYLKNVYRGRINNWDLVDVTCRDIIGAYLYDKPRDVLYELARSDDIWKKRVAIISTFYFIAKGEANDSIRISKILLHDKHDLIHKAVGWALREVGKRVDEKLLTDFLDKNAHAMPRTMLRYSIEKLSPEQKLHYMQLKAKSKNHEE